MARKKELMELENPSMEGNNPLDGTGTEAEAFPGEGTPPEADGDGMDLNELLGSMDQEPAAAPDLTEGELPELTEEGQRAVVSKLLLREMDFLNIPVKEYRPYATARDSPSGLIARFW